MRSFRNVVLVVLGLYAAIVGLAFWVCSDSALAHSGGTDSSGGHYNRKTGEYHHHGGKSKSKSRDSDVDYSYTPPAKPKSPPKSTTHRGSTGGRQVVRLSSSEGEDSGSFELVASAPAWDGSRTYEVSFSAEGGASKCGVHYDMTREELIECLEAMCAMLDELKAAE